MTGSGAKQGAGRRGACLQDGGVQDGGAQDGGVDPEQAAAAVVGLYRRHAAAFIEARSTTLVERAWLNRFLEVAGETAAILDVGCGSGLPLAAHMAGRGAQVTGVDSSPELLTAFARNVPGGTAIFCDMRKLELDRQFAGVLAWDSLFHLTQDDQRHLLVRLAARAAPGGALMFNSGPAEGVAIGTFAGEPLFHASLDPGEYRALLARNGFSLLGHQADDADCGGRTVWLWRKDG